MKSAGTFFLPGLGGVLHRLRVAVASVLGPAFLELGGEMLLPCHFISGAENKYPVQVVKTRLHLDRLHDIPAPPTSGVETG